VDVTNLVNAKPVTEVLGMTEAEMRNKNKQSEKQMLENFFGWIKKVKIKNFICHNPQFDYGFIWTKANKYNLKVPFYHRAFDISTISSVKYFQINKKFLIKDDYTDMGLKNILIFVGMEDNRKEHNALEDAKLTAECFSRLMYGKNLFPEYAKFPVPEYLRSVK
jgi:DNA polymerase III epsilon subunit-like protein